MGMFDTIQVPANILPAVPDYVTLGEFFGAQTKSLDRGMNSYKIEGGKLLKFCYEEIEAKESEVAFECMAYLKFPIFTRENKRWEEVKFHGVICFYASYNDWWMEYEAHFSYGKLDKITHLPFKNNKKKNQDADKTIRQLFGRPI